MKRFLSFLLILAVVLSMTGGRSCAGEAENVWNNTVNYVNRSSYADNQLVDRGFFSSIIGVSDDYLVMPLYDLQNNVSAYIIQYYFYNFLGADEHYATSLPLGSDIEFDLGEDPGNGLYWRVVSYDPAICRVKLEHDHNLVMPDKAEIELKALSPGQTDVVFTCGPKKFTVHFTAQ